MATALRVLFVFAALALAGLALTMNAYFWYQSQAADFKLAAIMVSLSIAAGVVKIAAPAFVAKTSSTWRREKTLGAVFAIAFVFDFTSGFGFSGMLRADAVARLEAYTSAVKESDRQIKAEQARLATYPDARPVIVVEPLAAQAKREAGSCSTQAQASTAKCRDAADLASELSTARARELILGKLETLNADRAKLKAPADSSVSAVLVRAAKGFNLEFNPALIDAFWTVLMFALLEIAPPALVASACKRPPDVPPRREAIRSAPAPPVSKRAAPAPGSGLSVLELLRQEPTDANGWITELSQQAIADRLRLGKTTVLRQMEAEAAAGRIIVDKSRRPAAIKVAGV